MLRRGCSRCSLHLYHIVPCRLERASKARLAWSVENPGSKANKRRTLCTTNSATTLRKLEGRLELRCTRILRYCRLARWRLYPRSHQRRPRSRARPCPEKSIEPAYQDSVSTPGANLNVLNSRPSSGRAAGTDVSMTAGVRFAGLARSAAAVHCERAAVHFPRAEGRRWHARGTVHSPIELGAQQLTRGFDGELGIDDFATASPRHSCGTEPVAKAATCGGQGSASPWISSAHMYLPHVEAASDTCCAISRTLASTRHPRPCRTCRGNSQAWGRDGRCVSREGVSPLRPPARRCGTPLTQTAGPQCLCRAHSTCRHQSPCSVRRYNRSLVHMAKSKRSMLG